MINLITQGISLFREVLVLGCCYSSSWKRKCTGLWIHPCVIFPSLKSASKDSNMMIYVIVDHVSWDPLEFILDILNASSLSCIQMKCLKNYQTGSSEQKLVRIWSTRDLLCKCLPQMKVEGAETHGEPCKCTICEESRRRGGQKSFPAHCCAEQISARTVAVPQQLLSPWGLRCCSGSHSSHAMLAYRLWKGRS